MANIGETAKRELQIPTEMQRLDKNIGNIRDAINILEDRMSSVISPAYPTPGTCEKELDRPSVPLAGDLKRVNVELAEISSRLYQLKDRCEL